MQLEELSNISDNLAMMADPALQQFAQMHKTDPYMVSLALSESNRRKKMRTAAQGQAGSMPQPKVVDAAIQGMTPAPAPAPAPMMAQTQLPENQGIAQIPTPNMRTLADGGIAGYEDDEEGMATGGMGGMFNFAQQSEPVVRMAGGGVPGYAKGVALPPDLEKYIDEQAKLNNIPPSALRAVIQAESEGKVDAQSKTSSAQGLMQLINRTFTKGGGDPAKRKDPFENVRVGAKVLGDDAAALRKKLNRDVSPEELYATHVLGRGTGSSLLQADPSMTMAQALKAADPKNADSIISSNSKLFGDGKKTVGEVMQTFSTKMASAVPIGTAQAGEPPKPAAPEVLTDKERAALEQPAFMTPSSGKGRKEGKLSEVIKSGEAPRQMALGVGDLPYNLAGAPMDIGYAVSKAFGNKGPAPALGSEHLKQLGTKYLGREADSTDPTLRGFRTAGELGSMVVDPFSATRKVAQTAEGLEGLALAQRAKVVEAEAKAAQTQPLRIEPPSAPQTIVADMQGNAVLPTGLSAETRARQQLEAQDIAQKALADRAARGVEAGRLAQTEKQLGEIPSLTQRAEMERLAVTSDKARGTALAAETGNLAEAGIKTLTKTEAPVERPEVGESVSGTFDTTMPKPSDVLAATKEAVPAKDRKGFGNDDLLMLGLSLMANKSPNFMTALGEAGIQTLGAKKEREKAETDLEYKDIMKKYYGALGTKAEADAKNLEAGTKYNAAARQHALDNISREMIKWEANPLNINATPQQVEAKRLSLAQTYFPLAGLELPSTMGAPAPSAGFKVLGSRPQ